MAQKAKGGNTVAAVEALVEPVLAQLGLRLWDVRYEKEGPDRFLRIFIDRDEPLDIDVCEEATRAINPVIDEADPIPESYYMEVGGPGLGRHLTKDAHFEAMRGREVLAHLIRPDETGARDVRGILVEKKDGVIVLDCAGDVRGIDAKAVSFCKLCDDDDLFD